MAAYGYSTTMAQGDFDQQHAAHQSACPICAGAHRATKCPEVAQAMACEANTSQLEETRALVAALRAQLATAHEVVGALLTNPYHDEALAAARAWLRREARHG